MPAPEISTSGAVPSNGTMEHLPAFERDAAAYTKASRTEQATQTVSHAEQTCSPLPAPRDSYTSTVFGDIIDRSLHAAMARFTAGLSPAALIEAYMDWAIHLVTSPGKQMQLLEKATKKNWRLAHHMSECAV